MERKFQITYGQWGLSYPWALKRFRRRNMCWQFIRNANGGTDPSVGNDALGISRYKFVAQHGSGQQHLSLSNNLFSLSHFHFHTSTYILTPPLSHFHTASGYWDISLSPNMVLVRGIFPFLIINFHVHTSTFTLSHFYFHTFTLSHSLGISRNKFVAQHGSGQ